MRNLPSCQLSAVGSTAPNAVGYPQIKTSPAFVLCHTAVAFITLHTRLAEFREQTVYCHSSVASKALFVALIKRGIY